MTYTREEQDQLLSLWKQSGKTIEAFCKEHNIKPHVFHYWKRKRTTKPCATDYIPIPMPSYAGVLEYVDTNGKRIVFYQPVPVSFLKELLS
jgi:predicted acyl esterase